jgi:transposase
MIFVIWMLILKKKIAKSFERIQAHIKSDPDIEKKVSNVWTTNGLGLLTVAIIIAETFGFEQFRNQRQLTSYAGYDVVERQSGSSIKGKTRISKKGNSRIRKAMFLPTMSYIRCNEAAKTRYDRIVDKKDIKMIGQVAAQRRLLILIYTLWKNNETYDEKKAAGIRLSRREVPSVEYDSVS